MMNVHDMTREETLQTMEMLWDKMCCNISNFPSPTWHQQRLQEQALQDGKDRVIEWKQARKERWTSAS